MYPDHELNRDLVHRFMLSLSATLAGQGFKSLNSFPRTPRPLPSLTLAFWEDQVHSHLLICKAVSWLISWPIVGAKDLVSPHTPNIFLTFSILFWLLHVLLWGDSLGLCSNSFIFVLLNIKIFYWLVFRESKGEKYEFVVPHIDAFISWFLYVSWLGSDHSLGTWGRCPNQLSSSARAPPHLLILKNRVIFLNSKGSSSFYIWFKCSVQEGHLESTDWNFTRHSCNSLHQKQDIYPQLRGPQVPSYTPPVLPSEGRPI